MTSDNEHIIDIEQSPVRVGALKPGQKLQRRNTRSIMETR
jgi:hypothetical protein